MFPLKVSRTFISNAWFKTLRGKSPLLCFSRPHVTLKYDSLSPLPLPCVCHRHKLDEGDDEGFVCCLAPSPRLSSHGPLIKWVNFPRVWEAAFQPAATAAAYGSREGGKRRGRQKVTNFHDFERTGEKRGPLLQYTSPSPRMGGRRPIFYFGGTTLYSRGQRSCLLLLMLRLVVLNSTTV